jgi:hypothetical protein
MLISEPPKAGHSATDGAEKVAGRHFGYQSKAIMSKLLDFPAQRKKMKNEGIGSEPKSNARARGVV